MPGTFAHEVWLARWSLLAGLSTTLSASLLTAIIGTVLGLVGGILLTYGWAPFRLLMRLYVDITRGIPVLVLILFTYYGLALFKINIPAFWAGVWALSAYSTAHIAETVRGAVQSIPQGQTEAGKSIGLRFHQIIVYVVVPQAVRRALPPWVNTILEIVKNTTLLSVIGVVELLLASQQAIARNYLILQFYFAATIVYFVINFAVAQLGSRLERRFGYLRY